MKLHFLKQKYDWYFPLLIGLIVLVGIVASLYTYKKVDQSGRKSLEERAATIAYAIDASEISILSGSESDLNLEAYKRLKTKLININKANPDSRFIYIMGHNGDSLFFYVDSEDPVSEDYSAPGDIYEDESPAFENAFTKGLSGTEGPIKDSFGTWITGVAPLITVSGKVIGAVGIDVDASTYMRESLTYASVPILLSLLLSVFAFAGLRINKAEKKWIALRTEFVTMASHELRSPLTGLLWANQSLVNDEGLSNEQIKKISEMKEVTGHLLEAVNDILDAAHFESGEEIMMETCELREIIRICVKELEFAAKDRDLLLLTELPGEAMPIKGNKSKLGRAFSNLISNAIKYSKKGGEVRVMGKIDREKRKYHLVVEDQGMGIPKAEQEKIWQGFYRASNIDKMKIKGTGLGMYVVKEIVKAHRGEIQLDSEVGRGTRIYIDLPIL